MKNLNAVASVANDKVVYATKVVVSGQNGIEDIFHYYNTVTAFECVRAAKEAGKKVSTSGERWLYGDCDD